MAMSIFRMRCALSSSEFQICKRHPSVPPLSPSWQLLPTCSVTEPTIRKGGSLQARTINYLRLCVLHEWHGELGKGQTPAIYYLGHSSLRTGSLLGQISTWPEAAPPEQAKFNWTEAHGLGLKWCTRKQWGRLPAGWCEPTKVTPSLRLPRHSSCHSSQEGKHSKLVTKLWLTVRT